MIKRNILFFTALTLALSFTGCKKTTTFEDEAKPKIINLTNESVKMQMDITNLQKDMEIVKRSIVTNAPVLQPNDLFFSSIRVATPDYKKVGAKYEVLYNPPADKTKKQTISFRVDVSNTTNLDLTQYSVDATLKYTKNGNLVSSYSTDVYFNIKKKDFRKDIVLSGFPVMSASTIHTLVISIKDGNGNVISSRTLDIPVTD